MTTTASSIPFATMEVPSLDDTMEMASPYQGQVDDFEIDLDVMEDQMSNPDKDMTAADDEAPTSNLDFNQYGPNDTDMTDDVAERAMLDADEQGLDNVDLRYGEDIYEADMAEDNYDEDIDAPVPNGEAQNVSVTLEDPNDQGPGEQAQPADRKDLAEGTSHESVVEPSVETWEDDADEHLDHDDTSKQRDDHAPETVPHAPEPPQIRTETAEEGLHETNSTERVDTQPAHTDGDEVDPTDLQHREHDIHEGDEANQLAEDPKDQHVQVTAQEEVYESNGQETDTSHQAPLHPLKVYYQDNEISLFPPREGDASEMFLLEDENLAHGDFGKLFDSCREVLQENVAENEILVLDIESVNIQLTEESSHLSQVTLHQIVDLYLRLCRNEDIVEPEPLYLTLSTKPTIPVQLSELLASVNEGKGLSDIQQWDDYDEAVPVSADGHEGPPDQEADVVPEQGIAAHHVSQEDLKEAEPSVHVQGAFDGLGEQESSGGGELEGEEGEGPAPGAEAEAEDGEVKEPEDNFQDVAHGGTGYHSPNEGSYDSEAQKTESSATLAQQLPDEQYDESARAPLDDQATDAAHVESGAEEAAEDDYDEPEAVDHGEYDDTQEAAGGEYHDTEEAAHEDYDEAYQEEAQAANTLEREDHGVPEGEHDATVEGGHKDLSQPENWSEGAAEEGESHTIEGEVDGSVHDGPASEQDTAPQDGLERKTREGAEPDDDLLGLSEDLNSPEADQVEPGEAHTDPLHTIPDHGDDWAFDDEDHVDLGAEEITETKQLEPSTTDSHGQENVATKRSREPEEGEVDENPTPDTKRRRSS